MNERITELIRACSANKREPASTEEFMKHYDELVEIFQGAAEEAGWQSEEDVISYCKQVRRKLAEERRLKNSR